MNMINRLKAVYFFRQVGETLVFSFFSLYLSLYGFSDYQVGELMGIVPVVMLFATPLLGLIDDGGKREKALLVTTNILIALVPLLLLIPNINYFYMAALIVVMSVVRAPISPAVDSLTTVVALNNGKRFSDVRIWASISYAVLMTFGGKLIDVVGFNFVIILCGFLTLVSVFLISTIPLQDIDRPQDNSVKADYKRLFKNKTFLLFVLINILTWAVWSASYNYEGVYFAEKFSNASIFGYVEAVRVVFEIIALVIMAKMKKEIPVKAIYLFFGFSAIAKYVIYYFNLPTFSLFLLAPFMGASFGMVIFCYIHYITKIVAKHNIHIAVFVITSAQMLFNAVYTYIGSVVVKYTNFYNIYILLTAVTVLGIVAVIFFKEHKPQI
ncbi:MAG TPA: MFS transporter, partial [Clostridia bacterium]|nr:MFS transporter [Clostridia bacterium]